VKKPQLAIAADQLYRLPSKMLGSVVRLHGTRGSHYYYAPNYYYRYSYTEDGEKQKDKRRRGTPAAERQV